MKMTIKQYYETLKAKRESARNELERTQLKYDKGELKFNEYCLDKGKILATIDTYTDSIYTLEASHLLDEET